MKKPKKPSRIPPKKDRECTYPISEGGLIWADITEDKIPEGYIGSVIRKPKKKGDYPICD